MNTENGHPPDWQLIKILPKNLKHKIEIEIFSPQMEDYGLLIMRINKMVLKLKANQRRRHSFLPCSLKIESIQYWHQWEE